MNLALWIVAGLLAAEFKFMVADLVYLALAAFVAWGRFGPEAFSG
ncbi:hypothetical protein [Salinibacterium sp. ZJ450]|nr:hypothetical protein [Salinibacterium sp. ZJ450]